MNRLPERIEVLAIGDELLDGRVADTNTLRLATALGAVGLRVAQRTTITDDVETIVREAKAVIGRGAELCIVSGGLGPTRDDVTAAAFAALASVELVRDEAQVRVIEEKLSFRGRQITENQRKQADRPRGALLIENPRGTAPGFDLTVNGCRFVSVPGVPREFDGMVQAVVIEPLRAITTPLEKRGLRCFGVPEAEVDARLARLVTDFPGVRQGFRAHFPEIHVTLSSSDEAELDAAAQEAKKLLAKECYTTEDKSYAQVVLETLRGRGMRLSLAESCTGGLIGDMLTDVPGSSDVLWGGAIVYANEAKLHSLGVASQTLDAHGAVSEETVREMVSGIRDRSGTECAVAVSGIAGPGGGTEEKPVGTVWMAAATPEVVKARKLQ
ncbi:MAG: CinA family nicotinamide mononucleotide deamidase-related protein, partial [Myxococcota bacterium]